MKLMKNSGFSQKTLGGRRRLFWIFGGVLLIALVGFFAFIPLTTQEKKRSAGPPKTREEALELVMRDTDADGLKDWEEKIYGTDPEKSDTDRDGTHDGDEIKMARNPLRAGPDDRLSVAIPPPEDENKTSALANKLISGSLTQIIAEGISGGELPANLADTPDLQNYIDKLGEERVLDKVIPPDEKEFTTSNDNSPQVVKAYFNRVADIYIKHFSSIDSDVSILYLAETGNNPRAFRRLDANIVAIQNAIDEIKKTPTPYKWIKFAKDDIWYLSKTLAAVKIFRNTENDPAASLLILRDRIQLLKDFGKFYIDTRTDLNASGITFNNDEPASRLLLQQ